MQVFVLSAPGRWPMLEFELDIVQRELDVGNTVFYAYCHGGVSYCEANNPRPQQQFRSSRCAVCISRVRSGLDWLEKPPGQLLEIEFRNVSATQEERIKEVTAQLMDPSVSVSDVKNRLSGREKICWNAALSSLSTGLRDGNPDLERYRGRFGLLVEQALESMASMENHLQRLQPDLVYVYNGRMARYWPALRAVEAARIPRKLYEFPALNYTDYPILDSSRLHDSEDYAIEIREKYFSLAAPKQMRLRVLASQWFEKARGGERKGVQNKVLAQSLRRIQLGQLPEEWPSAESQGVVSFFSSSQYELSASHSRSDQAIPNQIEIIRSCLERFPEVFFCVRVHPNQPDSDRDFIRSLGELREFPNCLVVGKESSADSVTVGLASTLPITFGSIVGIQLAWEGKRVIEFGTPTFSVFGATENIRDVQELFSRIEEAVKGTIHSRRYSDESREGAVLAMAARLGFGRRPVYVRKTSFRGARMVRQGQEARIRSKFFWVLLEVLDGVLADPIDFFERVQRRLKWSAK